VYARSDFEWYDPSAVTTKDGHLLITIDQEEIHDLNFKSGMVQSWNKLCFNKNAYFEVSASLPGTSTISGLVCGRWGIWVDRVMERLPRVSRCGTVMMTRVSRRVMGHWQPDTVVGLIVSS
jgi:hypothetical protein